MKEKKKIKRKKERKRKKRDKRVKDYLFVLLQWLKASPLIGNQDTNKCNMFVMNNFCFVNQAMFGCDKNSADIAKVYNN